MVLIFSSCLDELNLGLADSDMKLLASQTHYFRQQHSEYMVDTIKQFLNNNNYKITDIKGLYFTNGPGGFTGNRLGIILAKTLKVLNDVEVYTIDTLSSLCANSTGWISLDAKSKKFYSGKFQKGKLLKSIIISQENKNTIELNNEIIQNMILKFKFATKHNSLLDIKPLYIKEL